MTEILRGFSAGTAPNIASGLEKVQAAEGRSARFEIEVDGQPPPEISW